MLVPIIWTIPLLFVTKPPHYNAVSLFCPYLVWSCWLWTITFILPKSTELKIRLDWTRWASVNGHASACCDLDLLTLWRLKLIIIYMSPLTSVTNIGWNFLHRFLRHGIHKVFGTHRLTPSRPHSQTDRPEYSMPPAPFFNGGGVIINTKMKFRKVSSVILICAVVRDGCLIGPQTPHSYHSYHSYQRPGHLQYSMLAERSWSSIVVQS